MVIAIPHEGLGYLLIDLPDAGLLAQVLGEEDDQIRDIWRHLAQCCELASAPRDRVLTHVSEHSLLGQRLIEGDPPFDGSPRHLASQSPGTCALWRAMDDRAWRDYVALMDAYRSIHALAARLGVSLWSGQ
ncbi:MAG: hypothetical protein RIC89_15865 [Pseudomonadales bacterium]